MIPRATIQIFQRITICQAAAVITTQVKQNKQSWCLLIKRNATGSGYAHRTRYAMDKVYLRNVSDSEELHISFRYVNELLRVDRDFNFCRKMNENIENALIRIRNNIEKEFTKRAKKGIKKKSTPAEVATPLPPGIPSEIAIDFIRIGCDERIANVTFAEMLNDATAGLQLRVLDQNFEVVLNQPWVLNLVLPTSMLAGYAVYPSKVELQFADREHSRGAWFKTKTRPSGDQQNSSNWQHCGDGFIYNMSNDDVDYYLKFVLTPGNANGLFGPPVEYIAKRSVDPGPGPCPFETRHCFTRSQLSDANEIRVVSYNILADLYADSDYTRTTLFPYCPPYALQIDYRKQLFLKEIIGYNADIICLQEVDMKIFDLDLKPILQAGESGFNGVIAQKGSCGEGVATFYRKSRFELIRSYELNIGENIRTLPVFSSLWQLISDNELLVTRICDRSTTLQLNLLRCKQNGRFLLVANTHLYFHPDADHIRLLQIGFSLLYVEHIYKQTLLEQKISDERQLAIVFCGDFNSVPECGIYKLMTERIVENDFIDWSSNKAEAISNVTLRQPFTMASACGTPPYTNYTVGFAECLDYIFYQSDRFAVQQVVPLPTEDELKVHSAIPSVVFPSDHVALVADLAFKTLE